MKELDIVVLTEELPLLNLHAGDTGTIVMVHSGHTAYEVEFCAHDGVTVALETLLPGQIRPISHSEMAACL